MKVIAAIALAVVLGALTVVVCAGAVTYRALTPAWLEWKPAPEIAARFIVALGLLLLAGAMAL